MISIIVLVQIILIHSLADFALQTHDQAIKKSSDNYFLTLHVITYSIVWLLGSMILFPNNMYLVIPFTFITFCCHWITDWFTSRLNKSLFDKQNYHDGFIGIQFDQILHYVQLIVTYKLLIQ